MIWNGSSAWITNNSIAGGAASVVLGQGAGLAGGLSVNVGGLAGALTTSGGQSINIGYGAGENNNATGAVNVGYDAGHAGAGVGSVAVGQNAGAGNYPSIALGKYAVALGALADANTGAANSICINASGVALDAMLPSAMYVKPIRQPASAASNLLTWNPTTSEVVASSGTVGALTGDYLLWNSSTSSYVSNETLTNPSAVVIGAGAGSTSSPSGSIQIGAGANNSSLAVNGISIGHQAGSSLSTQYSILIGALANCTGSTVLAQLYIGSPVTPMQSINIGPFQYYTSPNVTVLYSGVTTQFGSIYLPINGTQISGTLTISTYSVPNVGEVISSTQQQLFAFANYNGTLTSSLSLLSAVATSGQSAPTLSLSTSGTTYILSINWSTVNSTGYEVQFLIASANPSGVVISSP
jgi:hypothetical protein